MGIVIINFVVQWDLSNQTGHLWDLSNQTSHPWDLLPGYTR